MGPSCPFRFRHILAAREELLWGGPELRGKTRATQNCCSGSGTDAFFIVWKNCSRFEHGTLSVHMHIDKLLPQAEIRCYQPYRGLLTIDLKASCKVRVRIPNFANPGEIAAKSSKGEVKLRIWGNYVELGDREAGEKHDKNTLGKTVRSSTSFANLSSKD